MCTTVPILIGYQAKVYNAHIFYLDFPSFIFVPSVSQVIFNLRLHFHDKLFPFFFKYGLTLLSDGLGVRGWFLNHTLINH